VFIAQFILHVRGHRRQGSLHVRFEQLVLLALAFLIFVIGMEEISWMQRVLQYETPAELAARNWQHEFNLHNMQTDLSEAVYYFGSALFLIFVPLVRDCLKDWGTLNSLRAFVPSRAVAAAAAPISIFNYGHWDLVPIQITVLLTPFVYLAYSRFAKEEGRPSQQWLFLGLALAVSIGQLVYLLRGSVMTQIYDATEYKELYIAVGLAYYSFDRFLAGRRERAR
jgi:hypothetical protein